MAATSTPKRADWVIPTLLIMLSLVPAIAGTNRLVQLASDTQVTADNARFFGQPIPVVLHILAVIPYSIIGAFQFSPGFRKRNRPWHRAAGRILGVAGLVAALSGLWMAHFYAWPAGDGLGVYIERLIFGTAMVWSIVLGLNAVRRRDFKAHGAWMTRAYAIGLGAGTQVLTHLPFFILVGKPGELGRTVMMGAGWVINVLFAEWVIWNGNRNGNGIGNGRANRVDRRRSDSLHRSLGSSAEAGVPGTVARLLPARSVGVAHAAGQDRA